MRQLQDHKESKNVRSVLKDAKIYARDMNLEMEFSSDDKTTVIKSDQRTVEIEDNQVKYLKIYFERSRSSNLRKDDTQSTMAWTKHNTTLE